MDHSLFLQEIPSRESPGSPVVRTPSFHCRVYGWGTKIPQPKKKKRNTQYKLSNSNRKNFFNSEKELNPKDILMLVESANCNNPNTLDTHINVEKNNGMLSSLFIYHGKGKSLENIWGELTC